jgi:hypothetical protein
MLLKARLIERKRQTAVINAYEEGYGAALADKPALKHKNRG